MKQLSFPSTRLQTAIPERKKAVVLYEGLQTTGSGGEGQNPMSPRINFLIQQRHGGGRHISEGKVYAAGLLPSLILH